MAFRQPGPRHRLAARGPGHLPHHWLPDGGGGDLLHSLCDSYAMAVVLMCLAAAAYDFGQGANWAALIDIGGRFAGVSTGFINMVGNIGNSLQGYFGAMIFSRYGWAPLFAVYAGAYLMAASMWLIIDPRKTFYVEKDANGMPVGGYGFEVLPARSIPGIDRPAQR